MDECVNKTCTLFQEIAARFSQCWLLWLCNLKQVFNHDNKKIPTPFNRNLIKLLLCLNATLTIALSDPKTMICNGFGKAQCQQQRHPPADSSSCSNGAWTDNVFWHF